MEEDTGIANKYMKNFQHHYHKGSQDTTRYHIAPTRMLILKRMIIIASAGKGLDHIGDSHTLLMGMFNYITPLGKCLTIFYKIKHTLIQ